MAPDLSLAQSAKVMTPADAELVQLLHRLNNQLGIILANAELLEHRLVDDSHRARAGQIIASALEAIASAQQIRRAAGAGPEHLGLRVESLTDRRQES